MGIKNWLKKSAMAISLAGALSGCDMLSPEGVAVKQDADGIVSAEEQADYENVLSSQEKVNDFTPYKGFVNEFNVFMGSEMASQGLDERRFDDELHVYMVRDKVEMAEKYAFGNINFLPPAFHGDTNSTLYILQDNYLPADFIMTFTHESGHDFRASAYEFPSKAHEMYFALRAYSFNRRIGSPFADYAVVIPYSMSADISKKCVPIDEYFSGDYYKYYAMGQLAFIVQANLENGNLERAFNNILTRPILYLEQNTVETARRYSDLCQAGLGELNKLLEKPGFMQGLLRDMSREEADEYVSYLRLNAANITYLMMENQGMPVGSTERGGFVRDMESFLNANPGNAYFRGNVTSLLSFEYYLKMSGMLNDPSQMMRLESKVEAHNLAKKIIGLNRDYPCSYKFYDCMGDVSEVRATHVLGYLSALYYSDELIAAGAENYSSMIAIPEEYAAKFYANSNYHYEDTNVNAAVYAPQITNYAGSLELKKANEMAWDGAEQERHVCAAVDWFNRTIEAGCSRIPDTEETKDKKQECLGAIGTGSEDSARDILRQIYDMGWRCH